MSYKYKLLFGFISYGVVLISIAFFTVYNINKSNLKIANIENAAQIYVEKKEFFNYQINHIELKLKSLKSSELFKKYISTKISTQNPLIMPPMQAQGLR